MRKYVIATLILILVIVFALFSGNSAIGTGNIIEVLFGGGTDSQRLIVFDIRIPRIVAALFSGAALSVSGYILQNNLNNTIASPGLLGINNGAGLFVLISACIFPYQAELKCLMAFIGALTVTFLVSLLSNGTGMSKTSVILSGVAVSAVCVSIIDVIISLKPETVADKAAFQLGGFASVPITSVKLAVPVIVAALILSFIFSPAMDLMALGDETASGLGLNIKLNRGILLLCASVMAGAAVSMCGLIGFVGLMVPNFVRLIYKGKARGGMILSTLIGAAFLLFCDTLSRLLVFPYELPCGLLLSILGAPFLIRILIKKRKRLGIND
ncbi:MAG: iron ABC transporter permease [Lachnospiraceae bacterium]|nr:iron ABC transporter permease [Lachnospiraceae bacterium]